MNSNITTKAGIVTVVGKPNAGKSTLLNRIIGQKLSITSDKPQATRDRIAGIRTTESVQMVILDTPGLLDPSYALQTAMKHNAVSALRDADVIVYLVDARDGTPPSLSEIAGIEIPSSIPVVTVINKIDILNRATLEAMREAQPSNMYISAINGDGVNELLTKLEEYLPVSPFLYPEDDISTQHTRFFVSEFIRETALELLSEEVPYSLACEIIEFKESKKPIVIRAVLYVERESQKKIIIGEKGKKIRDIGINSRAKIENMLGEQVFLDLWVKVLPNWRKDNAALRRLGFNLPKQG